MFDERDERIDNVETGTLYLTDLILTKLSRMEAVHPYLCNDQRYLALKIAIQDEHCEPSEDPEFLASIYPELINHLAVISAQRENLPTIGNAESLRTADFLPTTFAELLANPKPLSRSGVRGDETERMAEELINGVYEGGLDHIPLSCRAKVRAKVFELLVYDHGEGTQIEMNIKKFGESTVFELLQLDNQILKMIFERSSADTSEIEVEKNIAFIILSAREQMSYEHHNQYGRKRRTPETARIIPFPDRRRGVAETAVLLTTGVIKPPEKDHELQFHDAESMAAGALTTIWGMQQALLQQTALNNSTRQRTETICNAAESIIMGELNGGLRAIDGQYQAEILGVTVGLLADFSEDEHAIALITLQLGHAEILDVMGLTSQQLEEVQKQQDLETDDCPCLRADLASLILKVREKINQKSMREERLEKTRRVLRPMRLVK